MVDFSSGRQNTCVSGGSASQSGTKSLNVQRSLALSRFDVPAGTQSRQGEDTCRQSRLAGRGAGRAHNVRRSVVPRRNGCWSRTSGRRLESARRSFWMPGAGTISSTSWQLLGWLTRRHGAVFEICTLPLLVKDTGSADRVPIGASCKSCKRGLRQRLWITGLGLHGTSSLLVRASRTQYFSDRTQTFPVTQSTFDSALTPPPPSAAAPVRRNDSEAERSRHPEPASRARP